MNMTDTHATTPTRFVEVNGDKFAYLTAMFCATAWPNPP